MQATPLKADSDHCALKELPSRPGQELEAEIRDSMIQIYIKKAAPDSAAFHQLK